MTAPEATNRWQIQAERQATPLNPIPQRELLAGSQAEAVVKPLLEAIGDPEQERNWRQAMAFLPVVPVRFPALDE